MRPERVGNGMEGAPTRRGAQTRHNSDNEWRSGQGKKRTPARRPKTCASGRYERVECAGEKGTPWAAPKAASERGAKQARCAKHAARAPGALASRRCASAARRPASTPLPPLLLPLRCHAPVEDVREREEGEVDVVRREARAVDRGDKGLERGDGRRDGRVRELDALRAAAWARCAARAAAGCRRVRGRGAGQHAP